MLNLTVAVLLIATFFAALAAAQESDAPTTAPSDSAMFEAAQIAAREIAQSIQDDQQQIDAIRTRLAGGEADLPRIEADLKSATSKLEARQEAFAPIKARYEAAEQRLHEQQDHVLDQMKQAEEYQTAKAAADQADAARDRAEKAVTMLLERTRDYATANTALAAAEVRENYFHQAGPAFFRERQAFADRAADASVKLDSLKKSALEADPRVQQARKKAAGADGVVADLITQYRQRLAFNPDVAGAQTALDAEEGPYDAGLAMVRDGEARVAPIRAAYQRTMDGMAADRTALDELSTDLADAQSALSRINARIANASKG